MTGSVKDALRLGCAAIGFTIYPGSSARNTMYEEIREVIRFHIDGLKADGLAVPEPTSIAEYVEA